MSTVYIADTGVFVRCGGPANTKYQRLRRAVRRAETALHIPRRVYEELGGVGHSTDNKYPSSEIPWQAGIEEEWIVISEDLDYTNPLVATVMDQTRRFIAKRHGPSRRPNRKNGYSAHRPHRTVAGDEEGFPDRVANHGQTCGQSSRDVTSETRILPRGCTVTELAESFDIHKSAASRLLHRAESRIVKEFVGASTS